jgi:hypothetical protein
MSEIRIKFFVIYALAVFSAYLLKNRHKGGVVVEVAWRLFLAKTPIQVSN